MKIWPPTFLSGVEVMFPPPTVIGSRWIDAATDEVYEWDGNEWINLSEKENEE